MLPTRYSSRWVVTRTATAWLLSLVIVIAPAEVFAQGDTRAAYEALPDAIVEGPAVSRLAVSLPLAAADRIVDTALALAREHQMLPLTVVVLDSGGHMVAVKREDGSGIFRIEVANAKAYGALGMGVSTRLMGERLADRPVFAGSLTGLSEGRWVPVPGGVLIRDEQGRVIGSVGISGDTSDRDEYAAIRAVRAAGFFPEPLEPDPNWDGSHL